MQETSLLALITAQPDDDGHRQVYADWLEGEGRLTEAEVVRAEIALHTKPGDVDARGALHIARGRAPSRWLDRFERAARPTAVPLSLPAVEDMRNYQLLSDTDRLSIARRFAYALGPGWQPCSDLVGRFGLPAVTDPRSGELWVIVPGGPCQMGLSDEEHAAVVELFRRRSRADNAAFIESCLGSARPARHVWVAPFLCRQSPVTIAEGERFDVGRLALCSASAGGEDDDYPAAFPAQDAAAFAEDCGCSLLSETQWEYLARSGGGASWIDASSDGSGLSRFMDAIFHAPCPSDADEAAFSPLGIWGLQLPEWVAAGGGFEARGGGAMSSFPWQNLPHEMLACHAACRESDESFGVVLRLARPLPKLLDPIDLGRHLQPGWEEGLQIERDPSGAVCKLTLVKGDRTMSVESSKEGVYSYDTRVLHSGFDDAPRWIGLMMSDDVLVCSFCGAHQSDVRFLFAGHEVYICDDCAGICSEVLSEAREKR